MNLELEIPDDVTADTPESDIESLAQPEDFGKQLEIYHHQAVQLIPSDPLSVKQAAAFVETCKLAAKHAEMRRKDVVDPLNQQVKEHNAVWMPIAKGFDALWRDVDGRLSRYAWKIKQDAIAEQQRLIDASNAEKAKLAKQAEDARQASAAAATPQEAAKLEAKADRLELKSEMVVTEVMPVPAKAIDLGDSTLSVRAPKKDWMIPAWDKETKLYGDDPRLGDVDWNWLKRFVMIDTVRLNKAFAAGEKFPKPFEETVKFGGSTLRGNR